MKFIAQGILVRPCFAEIEAENIQEAAQKAQSCILNSWIEQGSETWQYQGVIWEKDYFETIRRGVVTG